MVSQRGAFWRWVLVVMEAPGGGGWRGGVRVQPAALPCRTPVARPAPHRPLGVSAPSPSRRGKRCRGRGDGTRPPTRDRGARPRPPRWRNPRPPRRAPPRGSARRGGKWGGSGGILGWSQRRRRTKFPCCGRETGGADSGSFGGFHLFAPRVPPAVGVRRARRFVVSGPAPRAAECHGGERSVAAIRDADCRRAGAAIVVSRWHGGGRGPAAAAVGAVPHAARGQGRFDRRPEESPPGLLPRPVFGAQPRT